MAAVLLGVWDFKRHSLRNGLISTKPLCHKLTQMGSCSTFADENHIADLLFSPFVLV